MTYSHLTSSKLAAHFHLTVPMLRKALIRLELLDEYTNEPTAEGHLLANAKIVDRVLPRPQLFPAWNVETLEALVPELSRGIRLREYINYPDRYAAADAMVIAGEHLADQFSNDDDINWLRFERFELVVADTRAKRKKFATDQLEPRVKRVRALMKKRRRSKRPGVVLAFDILDGLYCWAMGEKSPLNTESLKPLPFQAETAEREIGPDGFNLTQQEVDLLRTGFQFDALYAASPMPCFNAHVIHAAQLKGTVLPEGAFIRMFNRDGQDYLLIRYDDATDPAYADWSHAAWLVSIDQQRRLLFVEAQDADLFDTEFLFMGPRDADMKKSRAYRKALAA